MADPNIAEQWKALTPEQRDSALGQMNPAQKQQLADSLGYKAPTPTTAPPAPTPPPSLWQRAKDNFNANTSGAKPGDGPVKSALEDFGAGGGDVVRSIAHPIRTVEGMAQSVQPDPGIKGGIESFFGPAGPFLTHNVEAFVQNPARYLGQVGTGAIVGEGVGEVVGPATRALKATAESFRTGAQSMVGAGERSVKSAVGKEADAAQTSAETVKAANQSADEKTLAERGKVDEKNADAAAKDKQAKLDAAKKTRDAEQAHATDKAKVEGDNREAVRQQEKIAPTQQKLETASSELRARVETAREKALKVGNEKYNTVNAELSPLPADMEQVHNAYQEASDSIGDVQVEPSILKRLGTSLQRGDALTYKDLQGMYSELGKELSKGTLAGPVYHAYDVLHDSIGSDMQRIADSKGQGAQLLDARNYWRRMKQTFGRPLTLGDNATAAIKAANPDFMGDDTQGNRLRLLGSFDPEIPKVVEHIGNLRDGLEALPKAAPLRDVVKSPPAAPKSTPAPAPTPRAEYSEPNATKPIEVPEVNTQEIRQKLLDRWASGESSLNKWQVRALISGGLGSTIGLLFGHGLEGAELGGAASAASYVFGPSVVANILEKPAMREWLTRPPAAEIDALQKLPNADRIRIVDGLGKVVAQAKTQGIPVSPVVAGLVAGSQITGPKTQKLRQLQNGNQPPAQ